MKKSEELFVLVKSLSQAEKRYFRVLSNREGGEGSYLKLFNELAKQSEYDEAKIRAKLKGEPMLNQLHVTKNYLRQLILKSLRSFHSNESKNAEVKDILRNVEILYNKELHQHCNVELKRAERIAETFELDLSMIEIQNWKRKVRQRLNPHDYDGFLEILAKQNLALERATNLNDYTNLILEVSHNVVKQTDQKVANELLLEDISNAKSLEARVMHVNANYFRMTVENRGEEGEKMLIDLIKFMEEWPDRIKESPGLYLTTVNNFITYYVFTKRPLKALELIDRSKLMFEKWTLRSENRTILKQVLRTYNIELEVYRDAELITERASAIDDVEAFVIKHAQKMPKEYLVSFWFQLGYIQFMRKEFRSAVRWINQIIQFKDRTVRPDIQIHARILNLMIHLDLKNIMALGYFVASARRFIRRMRPLLDHEKQLLAFFSAAVKIPLLEYPQHFQKLKASLILSTTEEHPIRQQDFINFDKWVSDRSKP